MNFLAVVSKSCKGNYAISVKLIMHSSCTFFERKPYRRHMQELYIARNELFKLDASNLVCINMFTHKRFHLGGDFGDSQTVQPQIGDLTSAWLPQSEASSSTGRVVRYQNVFRPLRSASGQIRNGQARAQGKQPHQPGGPAIRLFAPDSLSSPYGLRPGRIGFSCAQPTGAETRAQAKCRNRQLSNGRTVRQSTVEDCGFSTDTARRIFVVGLSEQYRPGVAPAGKKTSLTTTAQETEKTRPSPVVKYEELRTKVLSGRIHAVRDGLVVILQKGLAAWLELCGSCKESSVKTKPASLEQVIPPAQHGALIGLFTNMALSRIQEVTT